MARSPWCDDVFVILFSRKSTQTVERSPTLSLLRTPKKIKKVIGLRPPVPAPFRLSSGMTSDGQVQDQEELPGQLVLSHQGILHHVGLKWPGANNLIL
jgi:hypothetical protein